MNINDHEFCPKCGWPSKGQYQENPHLGIYCSGRTVCGGCGYFDEVDYAKYLKIESEKNVRVQKLRENPPQFKSVEDWEKWNQEDHLVKMDKDPMGI